MPKIFIDLEPGHEIKYDKDGKVHCDTGPAIIYGKTVKLYFIHGKQLTEEEFQEMHSKRAS